MLLCLDRGLEWRRAQRSELLVRYTTVTVLLHLYVLRVKGLNVRSEVRTYNIFSFLFIIFIMKIVHKCLKMVWYPIQHENNTSTPSITTKSSLVIAWCLVRTPILLRFEIICTLLSLCLQHTWLPFLMAVFNPRVVDNTLRVLYSHVRIPHGVKKLTGSCAENENSGWLASAIYLWSWVGSIWGLDKSIDVG